MPNLPPRPTLVANKSKGPSSGSTGAGTRASQERKREDAKARGVPLKTTATHYPHVDWDEVEDVVTHVVDIAGVISHSQVGTTGNVVSSINCPTAYAHAVLEAHLASRDGLAYIRIYTVDRAVFEQKQALMAAQAAADEAGLSLEEFVAQQETLFAETEFTGPRTLT